MCEDNVQFFDVKGTDTVCLFLNIHTFFFWSSFARRYIKTVAYACLSMLSGRDECA